MRHPAGTRLPDGRGARPNTVNISQRPAEAADRAVPGHWEGDLVYLPRTVNMRDYTQTDSDTVADELNDRPRQTLGFELTRTISAAVAMIA